MSHQVLSRRYRPQGFDELVGQEHVARILRNALKSGRVGHAYLLVGPRGVGKTTTARIFAKAINCTKRAVVPSPLRSPKGDAPARVPTPSGSSTPPGDSVEPCGECVSCRDVTAGSDLDVVEIDAASNNAVDDVRALREQVGYAPVRSPYRIWIVDEVHMLSLPAFNAFLKTLEEPPPHAKFLFCTTEEHRLPTTFRSRCQVVEFRPIAPAAIAGRLADLASREQAQVEPEVLHRIAAGALGGLRDAESQLEQLLAARDGDRVTVADLDALSGRAPAERMAALLAAVAGGDAGGALDALDACLAGSAKPGVLADQWLEAQRVELVAAARGTDGGALARASRALDVLLGKRAHLKAGADGALVLQAAAVELARLPHARDLEQLIEALRGEERRTRTSPPGATSGGAAPAGPGRLVRPPPAAGPATAPGGGRVSAPGTPFAGPGAAPAVPGPAAALPRAPLLASNPALPETAGLDVETVRAKWDALAEVAARRDVRLRDALRRVRVVAVGGGRISLALGRQEAMARSTLERKEMVSAFRQAAREVLGVELTPSLETLPEASAPAPVGDSSLREHPEVRRVAEATGGRVLSVERVVGTPPAAGGAEASGELQAGSAPAP